MEYVNIKMKAGGSLSCESIKVSNNCTIQTNFKIKSNLISERFIRMNILFKIMREILQMEMILYSFIEMEQSVILHRNHEKRK